MVTVWSFGNILAQAAIYVIIPFALTPSVNIVRNIRR